MGLEVDDASEILLTREQTGNSGFIPSIGTVAVRAGGQRFPVFLSVVNGNFNLPTFQFRGNLRRTVTGNTESEDLPHDRCGLFIDDPMMLVFRILHITVWRGRCKRLAGIALCLKYGLYLTAGVLGIELVEDVDERRHVVLGAVVTVHPENVYPVIVGLLIVNVGVSTVYVPG